MLRRAAVPFKSTAGFHPTPRLVFALSLPLGVVGRDEVVELELTQPRDSEELLAALNVQAPAGLSFTRASVVPMKATATPRRVVYELPLPAERVGEVESAVSELLSEPKVWVERLRPSPKRLNIRPYLRGVSVVRSRSERERQPLAQRAGHTLLLDLWVTQTGTARADELLRRLGVADLIETGVVLERTLVEIRDEIPVHEPADGPPDGPADAQRLTSAEVAALTARLEEETGEPCSQGQWVREQPAEVGWGASPNGPVVE
jgi:radical SAM-linked protein